LPRATQATELAAIEALFRRAPYLHLYELGDLDPREAAHTTWFVSQLDARGEAVDGGIDAVVLLYRGLSTPTIVALADDNPAAVHELLAQTASELPPRCYAHLTPGLEAALAPRFRAELLGHSLKMGLTAPVAGAVDPSIVALSPADADEVVRFYADSYPAGYFEPVSLERGPHVAIRDDRGIAAIAGVHVYSPAKRVASLGNIACRPDARGRGHAGRVTAELCRRLHPEIEVIGLNVRASNAAAIACYRGVGFDVRYAFNEWLIVASSPVAGFS
jgi:GNAT superfamily N-acetyltransferase